MPNILTDIKNLKTQVRVLIDNITKDKEYLNYDIEAGKINTSRAQKTADEANAVANDNKNSIIEAEQSITDMDLQSIETQQQLTDMDLRLLELEVNK